MKLIYVNSNAPIGDLPFEFVAGDSLIRLSDGRMSFNFLLLEHDGVLHEKMLESVGCKLGGIHTPCVLFDFDQVNKRSGDKRTLQLFIEKFQNNIVKSLLKNLLDILQYQEDAIDTTIIGSIYRNVNYVDSVNILSIEDYIFPQYLSLPAKEMMTRYFQSGERDLRSIYQRIRTSYFADFQAALRLFKRDYPDANIYSEREKKSVIIQSCEDFLSAALTANGYSLVLGQNNVWINAEGRQIKIEIKDPKPSITINGEQPPKKNGKAWSKSDEKYLLTAFSCRVPYAEIANKLQRTESAIRGRLCHLGVLAFDKEKGVYVPIAEKQPAQLQTEVLSDLSADELLLCIPVDKSILMAGFSIPQNRVNLWLSHLSAPISKGGHADVRIMIDNNWYAAKIKRIDFSKYPDHPENYQLLYSSSSSLACKLREICGADLSGIANKAIHGNKKRPNYGVAYFYATDKKNQYRLVIKK